MKRVVVAGGTGLVGGHVLDCLAGRGDVDTVALVRRAGAIAPRPNMTETVFDFQSPGAYERLGAEIPCDAFFSCLGTTLRKAGSREAFLRVDRDLPAAFVRRLSALPAKPVFGLVSSVGASETSAFYMRVKAEVERLVIESGLPYVIVRPSFLLGERRESRPLEHLFTSALGPLTRGLESLGARGSPFLGRYLGVEAAGVARTLVARVLEPSGGAPPAEIVDGWELHGAH